MKSPKPIPTKTHMLFCRVTPAEKHHFMSTCKRLGQTQSTVLNTLVREFLKANEKPIMAESKKGSPK